MKLSTKLWKNIMNLPGSPGDDVPFGGFAPERHALKGGVSCERCIIHEVRPVRKLFNCGVCCHFLLVLPIPTALKLPRREAGSWVSDPAANEIERGIGIGFSPYFISKAMFSGFYLTTFNDPELRWWSFAVPNNTPLPNSAAAAKLPSLK
jgi:hypothetical protein